MNTNVGWGGRIASDRLGDFWDFDAVRRIVQICARSLVFLEVRGEGHE